MIQKEMGYGSYDYNIPVLKTEGQGVNHAKTWHSRCKSTEEIMSFMSFRNKKGVVAKARW